MSWSNNVTFNFNILRITVTQILPNIAPKLGPKCPFSSFLRIIFGVFAKTFFKTVQTFKMGHSLKLPVKKNIFLQGGAPRGSRKSPNQPKIAVLTRFTQICWDIFHKLPLNSMLIAIRVPLKLCCFFLNCFGLSNGPKNGQKLAQNALFPYSLELFLVFLLKHSSKQYRLSKLVIV